MRETVVRGVILVYFVCARDDYVVPVRGNTNDD